VSSTTVVIKQSLSCVKQKASITLTSHVGTRRLSNVLATLVRFNEILFVDGPHKELFHHQASDISSCDGGHEGGIETNFSIRMCCSGGGGGGDGNYLLCLRMCC
jgi:hypothetical protein